MGNLGQIPHHQGQVVTVIDLPNLPNAIQRLLVAQMASQRVARIGRQGNDGTVADELCRLHQQARLRRIRMNIDNTGHG